MQAERWGDRIALRTEWRDKDLVRALPGSRWSPEHKVWSVPLAWSACKALRGLFGDRLEIGPELRVWATHELTTRVQPALTLREQLDGEGHVDLFPFQKPGVQFLKVAGQALLADEMGTGKTVQTVVAVNELDAYPVCVIAPNSMKLTWKKEWERWGDADMIIPVRGGADKRRKQLADAQAAIDAGERVVVVINWESVRLHSRLAAYGSVRLTDEESTKKELNTIPFRTVIADEAHKLKDPKAKQTRAVWAVAQGDKVEHRYALTGTPVANNPADTWSILHFIAPDEFPSKTKFVDRYCLVSWNPFGGLDIAGVRPDTKEEFFAILDPRMRRMPKDLVLPHLPPKLRQTRWAEMGPKQAKAYKQMLDHMVAQLEEGDMVLTTNPLAQLTRLVQFSSAYATLDDAGELHLAEPSCKLNEMMEVIEELDGESVVVAAQSRQLIEMACARLEKAGVSYRTIVGGMTEEAREQAKEDFQAGRAQVMLFTIQAGGVGLTLTRAGVIVFLQRSWSMLDNKQAEDRVHRIGSEQHDKILIVDIVAQGTVEERQIDMLNEKAEKLEEVVRDRDLLRRLLKGDHR